jgi:hypothetical protein
VPAGIIPESVLNKSLKGFSLLPSETIAPEDGAGLFLSVEEEACARGDRSFHRGPNLSWVQHAAQPSCRARSRNESRSEAHYSEISWPASAPIRRSR